MKTNLLKINLAVAIMGFTAGAIAQSGNQNKTHIKIDEIINGKEMKIDTSFTGLSDAEIHNRLSKLGVNDLTEVNGNADQDMLLADASGNDSVKTRVIIIKNNDEDGTMDENVKILPGKESKSCTVVVGNDGGSYTTTGDSSIKTKVIIKKINKDGKSTEIRMSTKIVKVESVTPKDNNPLKTDVSTSTMPFSELKVFPNPTEANLNILYKTVGTDPMIINIYDTKGTLVYTEKVTDTNTRVCKTISMSSLSPGMYFVQLNQGNQIETKKVVVR